MVWYFNFCKYYLPNDSVINLNRTLIFSGLFMQVLLYTFARYALTYCQRSTYTKGSASNGNTFKGRKSEEIDPEERSQQSTDKDNKSTSIEHKTTFGQRKSDSDQSSAALNKTRDRVKEQEYPNKAGSFFERIDIAEFDKHFGAFLGHHAIAIGMCSIFCPHYPFTLASLAYLLLGLAVFLFYGLDYPRVVFVLWTVILVINVFLFFAATSNVGLSNYDDQSDLCYSQESLNG